MTAIVPDQPSLHELHSRPFASLREEYDYRVEDIEGALPAALTGTLFRIGPGKFEVGDTVLKTMFDADGMVSRFILDGKSVHFTNRYVRTEQYLGGDTMSRRGITTNAPSLRGNLRWPPTRPTPTSSRCVVSCWRCGKGAARTGSTPNPWTRWVPSTSTATGWDTWARSRRIRSGTPHR